MPGRRLKVILVVLMALVWLAPTALSAEGQSMLQIEIAKKYYQALYTGDFETVRLVASAEMKFADPSAPHEFGIPAQLHDLESFLTFMQANLPDNVEVNISESFASNNQVLLMVTSKGTISAETAGMGDKGSVEFLVKGVSVLQVVDGRVIQHTDYFDYPALAKSFKPVD